MELILPIGLGGSGQAGIGLVPNLPGLGAPLPSTGLVPIPITANLELWLRSKFLAQEQAPGVVGTWADHSGQGNDATEASRKPSLVAGATDAGGPAVEFTDSGDHTTSNRLVLTTGLSGATFSVFAVVKNTDAANGSVILGKLGGLTDYLYTKNLNRLSSSGGDVDSGAFTDGQWTIVEARANGTNVTVYNNGVAGTPSGIGSWLPDVIGQYEGDPYQMSGYIAEIAYYTDCKNDTDALAIRQYLATEHGITLP